jgi:hypothetical protein
MQKLVSAQNDLTGLFEELKTRGGELNVAVGRFAEIKAKIKIKKEQINTLKILIKAEGSHL